MSRALPGALLMILSLFPGVGAGAGIYRWVGADGSVHFGDQPGALGATRVTPAPAPPASEDPDRAEHELRRKRLLRAFDEEHAEKRAREERAQREAQQRKRNCAVARDRLRVYASAHYLYDIDARGNRVILSDAAYAKTMEQARQAVQQWCGDGSG
ncbi:MAG: hypothetical protein B7Z66_12930 [Chromatiales bacterium 21-64-14]|nr:MAG: hypothetical protein B7Z66_12930 [Chromatiales bacterium 21-64-14]HQU16365.1 DUF4124 domain-containing protein [Gammaproteobacteria bacterium]